MSGRAILGAVLPKFVTGGLALTGRNALIDGVLLGVSFVAVNEASTWLATRPVTGGATLRPGALALPHLGTVLLFAALVALLNQSEGLYGTDSACRSPQLRWRLGRSVFWAMLLTSVVSPQRGHHEMTFLIAGGVPSFLAMFGWRYWLGQRTARRRANGQGVRNVLVVGAGKLGQEVAQVLEDQDDRCLVVGFLDEDGAAASGVCGRPEDLAQIARANFVDEVILAMPHRRDLAWRVVQQARRCQLDIRVVPDLFGQAPESLAFGSLGRLPMLVLHKERVPALGPFLKRAFDVVASSAALLMTTPLLAAIALAVKLDSSGPVLYAAPRAGRKGKIFRCHKFRTMVADADRLKECLRSRNERQGPFFKIANDPRVTRVGRLLRRYSLDELPQLWNVLRGEMSLVGPRPHPLDDCRYYQLDHLRRLDVTPGITGLWQVTARGDPSFVRGLALDLEYIERWNFWMDLRILCRTVGVVLQGTGA